MLQCSGSRRLIVSDYPGITRISSWQSSYHSRVHAYYSWCTAGCIHSSSPSHRNSTLLSSWAVPDPIILGKDSFHQGFLLGRICCSEQQNHYCHYRWHTKVSGIEIGGINLCDKTAERKWLLSGLLALCTAFCFRSSLLWDVGPNSLPDYKVL